MIITVTERNTYKRCRRQWDFSSLNRQGIQPIINPSTALNLGTLVHRTLADWVQDPKLELWLEGKSFEGYPEFGKLDELFMYHAALMMQGIESTYRAAVGLSPSNAELAPMLDAVELGRAMMTNYQTLYKQPLPSNFSFVMPEQEVMAPILGTKRQCSVCGGQGVLNISKMVLDDNDEIIKETVESIKCGPCDGTSIEQHYLKGKLDGLVQDSKGLLYVLERKTYSRRPNMSTLERNDQFLAYEWLVNQLGIGKCGGVLYDGLSKKKSPGRGETLKDLFIRTKLTRTPHELEEFESELIAEANEMNSNPFITKYIPFNDCFDCSYKGLCDAISKGEDWEYVRKRHYTERTGDVSAFDE